MIDLSNNNGAVDFETVRRSGQYRVYLKVSEGSTFADPLFTTRYHAARAAGMLVGGYHFARPSENTPAEEALHFSRLLPPLEGGASLLPMFDLEDPQIRPDKNLGAWAHEFATLMLGYMKRKVVLYGYASYLQSCELTPADYEGVLIASYGRNDGKEYPYTIPSPFTARSILAQQITSNGRVPGCTGNVDVSVVFNGKLDVPKPRKLFSRQHLQHAEGWQ